MHLHRPLLYHTIPYHTIAQRRSFHFHVHDPRHNRVVQVCLLDTRDTMHAGSVRENDVEAAMKLARTQPFDVCFFFLCLGRRLRLEVRGCDH